MSKSESGFTKYENDIDFKRAFCVNCGHYHRHSRRTKKAALKFDCTVSDCKCAESFYVARSGRGSFA